MTKTTTGLPNSPGEADILKLFYLCQFIMQPIRDYAGLILVDSGYRSVIVNEKVGGISESQHLYGEACDFRAPEKYLHHVFQWIINESNIAFRQCILEVKSDIQWIHISLPTIKQDKIRQAFIKYIGGKIA